MAESRSAPRRPNPDRVLNAAMALAARRPWRTVSMADIAAEAKTDLARLYEVFPSRAEIVAALAARVDRAVLAGTDADVAEAPVRDRLIDVLMRRLDALEGDKDAVASMLRDSVTDPCAALTSLPPLMRSMAWSLEAAGVRSNGLDGALRTRALAVIWVSTVRVWLRDDSPDLGRTLAHLDRALRRAEWLAERCVRRAPRPRKAAPAQPAA